MNLDLIFAIAFFAVTLYFTIKHFKIVRAVSYIERLNHPDMIAVRAKVERWLASEKSDTEKLEDVAQGSELRVNVMTLLNLFSELGVAYKMRIVDRKVVMTTFHPVLLNFWKRLEFYIRDERDSGNPIAHLFEELAIKMEKKHERS